jgi:hypothetical protein
MNIKGEGKMLKKLMNLFKSNQPRKVSACCGTDLTYSDYLESKICSECGAKIIND